jgi:hypothetical protein
MHSAHDKEQFVHTVAERIGDFCRSRNMYTILPVIGSLVSDDVGGRARMTLYDGAGSIPGHAIFSG